MVTVDRRSTASVVAQHDQRRREWHRSLSGGVDARSDQRRRHDRAWRRSVADPIALRDDQRRRRRWRCPTDGEGDGRRASCTNGGIRRRIARQLRGLASRSRRRLEGRLNGGGTPIELHTTNGGIAAIARLDKLDRHRCQMGDRHELTAEESDTDDRERIGTRERRQGQPLSPPQAPGERRVDRSGALLLLGGLLATGGSIGPSRRRRTDRRRSAPGAWHAALTVVVLRRAAVAPQRSRRPAARLLQRLPISNAATASRTRRCGGWLLDQAEVVWHRADPRRPPRRASSTP